MFSSWLCYAILILCWAQGAFAIRQNRDDPADKDLSHSGGKLGDAAVCQSKDNLDCDGIWWVESWPLAFNDNQLVTQGPKTSVTFSFSGDEIYVYGIPPDDQGATAYFTLDDALPQRVNTALLQGPKGESVILWSQVGLGDGEHTLEVAYDPQSRADGKVRYLRIDYFSFNVPSAIFTDPPLTPSPNLRGHPTSTLQDPGSTQIAVNSLGHTWKQYVTPAPIIGGFIGGTMVMLLLGIVLFRHRQQRKRWQNAIAPDPFIQSDRGSRNWQFPTTFRDSFSRSTPELFSEAAPQESNLAQQYSRSQQGVYPIPLVFPPPPRPPPTVSTTHYGDQIAETLSTRSSDDSGESVYQPRGYRIHVPGARYQQPDDSMLYHHV